MDAGRIDRLDIQAFERALDALPYRGEPDLPYALVDGPVPGTRLEVIVSDGDHGDVRMPPLPRWDEAGKTAILSVALLTPTRDSRAEHGLLAGTRQNWLAGRSQVAVVLQAGLPKSLRTALPAPAVRADSYAKWPDDLERRRAEWWDPARFSPDALDAAAREVGGLAAELVKQQGAMTRGSHTTLRLPGSGLRTAALVLALVFLALVYHLGTGAANWGEWRVLAALTLATCVPPLVAVPALLPATDALLSPTAWTYGDGILDSTAAVGRWVLMLVSFAVGIRAALAALLAPTSR